jgi:hypothetical protein
MKVILTNPPTGGSNALPSSVDHLFIGDFNNRSIHLEPPILSLAPGAWNSMLSSGKPGIKYPANPVNPVYMIFIKIESNHFLQTAKVWIRLYYLFFGQDLRDFLGLFVVFLSFRMKLRKFNPLGGGKDQPVHNPYLFGQLLVACFTNSSRRHIIASPKAIVLGKFLPAVVQVA